MVYKIFISHKQEDHHEALQIEKILKAHGVNTYLDVLDQSLSGDGERLTRHIKSKLRECTDLIVVLSHNTKSSWWVPFEIGMASEKDMPIANFLLSNEKLPEYLEYWPRLKNDSDLAKYVITRKKIGENTFRKKSLNESTGYFSNDVSETNQFYAELKKQL